MRAGLILALLAATLTGCPEAHRRPDDFKADPAPLLAAVAVRAAAVRGLSGQLKLEVWRGDERVKLRQLVASQPPDKLRVDSLSPFDQPLSTLVAAHGRLSIYSLEERRFYVGAASPQNLARLIPVRLSPGEMGALLRGTVPLIAHHTAQVAWDGAHGWIQLDLRGDGATRQRVHFEPEHLRVVEVRAWQGEALRYAARLGRYEGEGPAAMPTRMRFEAPAESLRVDVEVVDYTLNPDLPDEAFELSPPRGVTVESLD